MISLANQRPLKSTAVPHLRADELSKRKDRPPAGGIAKFATEPKNVHEQLMIKIFAPNIVF